MKKAYPKYKKTDLPWLKQIPAHWEVVKVKFLFDERVEKGFPKEPLLAATQTQGVVPKELYETRTVTAQKDFHLLKLVEVGDFVISLRSFQGGIEYAHYRGIISPAYTIMKPKSDVYGGYFRHHFKSKHLVGDLSTYVTGIREGQNIDYSEFRDSYQPLPPLPEQQKIAEYLDYKCKLIDTFIEKKSRLIELLKEQKQAIINKAVTKGIDPDVPMKPSGIEWLGDIPEHWEVKKLKYDISVRGRVGWKALTASEYVEEGNVFLATPNIKNYDIDFDNVNYINDFRYYESPELILELNDILLTKDGSTTGTVNIIRELPKPSTVNSSIALLRPNSSFFSPYLYYLFQSEYIDKLIKLKMLGMGVPHLYQADIKNFFLIKPTLKEQREIVNYIESERLRLDKIISSVNREMELIKEYKTTLIAEAVTGKIDVRNWQAKESTDKTQTVSAG